MKKGEIIAKGEVMDNNDGCNIANTGSQLKWVAVRGDSHDWAIYVNNPGFHYGHYATIVKYGHKVHAGNFIQKLVPCDNEAFRRYKH